MAFPSTIDNFTPKVDNVDDVIAQDVNELQTAIESLETKVGINASAEVTSLDYLIKSASNPGHNHNGVYAPVLGADDNYVTDAEKVKLSNLSGTNTGDETTTTLGNTINGATAKTTPVDADMVGLMDSAASNVLKKLSWANIKATLKTYFDTLYQAAGSYVLTTRTISTTSPLTGGGNLSANRTLEINDATTAQKGAVQLTDSISSTSTTTAATPNSVKTAYDLANAALPKSGGTLTGESNLGENAGFGYDNALSADGKYSGFVIDGTAGATLAFGDIVMFQASDSRWELADANVTTAAQADARGLIGVCVLAASGDGQATKVLLQGFVRADTAFPTLTINGQVYLSETAGDITQTKPTTADVAIRVLGVAFTADAIWFNPSPDYITHT